MKIFKVDELAVHEPGEHRIPVEEGELEEVAEKELRKLQTGAETRTQLTTYFEYNRAHPGLDLTYDRVYERLRWDKKFHRWIPYVEGYERREKLCRLRTVSPTNLNLLVCEIVF